MKLAAIYNVWGDWEIFFESIKNIKCLVDDVIVVLSDNSNYGEPSEPIAYNTQNKHFKTVLGYEIHWYEPVIGVPPMTNETNKRNYGIDIARKKGCTHFLIMDADEFYEPNEFEEAKRTIGEKHGLVCRSKVYFREPTLTIGYDTTLVPFIHKLTPNIHCTFNRNYPFAWTDKDGVPFTDKKRIRIDPTRSYNINTGVFWSEVTMHHYSYVRSDLRRKIRNSTARHNIEKSTVIQDYLNAKPGYFCQFYDKTLQECPNIFGIPRIIDDNVT